MKHKIAENEIEKRIVTSARTQSFFIRILHVKIYNHCLPDTFERPYELFVSPDSPESQKTENDRNNGIQRIQL